MVSSFEDNKHSCFSQTRRELEQVAGRRELELAKLGGGIVMTSVVQTGLHHAREMLNEKFKQKVEKELTGKESARADVLSTRARPS